MMLIRLTKAFGRMPTEALAAQFLPPGGTIGRGADCTLVLPDPGKHVSRVQANVRVGPAGCMIQCTSNANPLFVNGIELTNGQSAPLTGGELIAVAGFEMVTQAMAPIANAPSNQPNATVPDDLFADLLGTPRAPTQPAAPMPMLSTPPMSPAPPVRDDGRAAGMGQRMALPDDFDPFRGLDAGLPAPRAGNGSNSGVPQGHPLNPFDMNPPRDGDTDPLSSLSSRSSRSPGSAGPGSGFGDVISTPPAADSLDALFDLGSAKDPFGMDSPLSAPISAPNTAGSDDPLSSLSAEPSRPPDRAFADRGSPLQNSMALPGAPKAPSGFPDLTGASSQQALIDAGAVLSWSSKADVEAPLTDHRNAEHDVAPITRPTSFVAEVNRNQLEAMERARAANPRYAESRAMAPPAGLSPAQSSMSHHDGFELLKAFLLGAGLAELPRAPGQPQPQAMTPDLMRRIGELLSVSIQGTVDLLQARSVMKRELRSDVTMIVAKNNNPLKFSPDATSAMAHLLAQKPVKGFLEPAPAMRDAFDDLLAHQLGVVAGMRAAMTGLVQRFDPASLEDKLARRSMLDAMLSMSRKARLWELFTERFAELSREAQDDIDAVFWQAFTKAYDEQIERVKAGGR